MTIGTYVNVVGCNRLKAKMTGTGMDLIVFDSRDESARTVISCLLDEDVAQAYAHAINGVTEHLNDVQVRREETPAVEQPVPLTADEIPF
jgi:hypothetical protein